MFLILREDSFVSLCQSIKAQAISRVSIFRVHMCTICSKWELDPKLRYPKDRPVTLTEGWHWQGHSALVTPEVTAALHLNDPEDWVHPQDPHSRFWAMRMDGRLPSFLARGCSTMGIRGLVPILFGDFAFCCCLFITRLHLSSEVYLEAFELLTNNRPALRIPLPSS